MTDNGSTNDINQDRERLLSIERQRRAEVQEAALALRAPFRRTVEVHSIVRRLAPMLPAAALLVTALLVIMQLRRGRLRPVFMLATAVDVWRLWMMLRSPEPPPALPSLPGKP